jgi:DNA/RNA-binding domain of Phe-tRNA-synthetase-like protein
LKISFNIDQEVLSEFPDAQVRFVAAEGLQNAGPWADVAKELQGVEERVASGEWQPFQETDPAIASWHDAYRSFGTNPRKFRPSIDALSRRLTRNGQLPRINPAVDAYNLISVTFGVPAGAFDAVGLADRVMIRLARPGDSFTPLGEPDVAEEPKTGEVVYAQESQVLTRHWNYRDSDSTKVTEDSRAVVFILERISAAAVSSGQLADAQSALAELIRPHADHVALAAIDATAPAADVLER